MKKTRSMLILVPLLPLYLLGLLSSCDGEEVKGIVSTEEVCFSMRGNETKSTQTGTFDVGDLIGIFAVEHGGIGGSSRNLATNLPYRFDGSGFKPAPGITPIRFNGKRMDFYAYAPYDASNGDIRAIRAVAVDQDAASGWKASDFVTAVNVTGIQEGVVPLCFSHKFATVRLNVKEIPGITGAVINAVRTGATLDFATDKAVATGSATSLRMFPRGGGNGILTYELAVPVQNLGTGALFTLRRSSGGDARCVADVVKTLGEGEITPYGIDLMMGVSFGAFPSYMGTATGEGKYAFNSNCTVRAIPTTGYHFTGWLENGTRVSDNASYSFAIIQDRVLTPTFLTDTTYGAWQVSVSANPSTIASTGGSSVITATAVRDVLVNGIKAKTESGTPTLSRDNAAFTLSGNTLSVGSNTSTSARACTVTASYGGQSSNFAVIQNGVVITTDTSYEISVSPTGYTFASTGGSKAFSVTCTRIVRTYWDGSLVNTDRTAYGGYSASVSGGGFSCSGTTVSATRNGNTSSRSGTFTVSVGGYSASASLSQEGALDIGTEI